MLIGQSCRWFLSGPIVWARDRGAELRQGLSRSFASGAVRLSTSQAQANSHSPDHDRTGDGLHRDGKDGDREVRSQRNEPTIASVDRPAFCFENYAAAKTTRLGAWARRFRYAWPLLLFAVVPLQHTRWANAQVDYDSALGHFLHGELAKSQLEAEQGYRRFQICDPKWASRFLLLEAKAMVWRGVYADALRILAVLPATLHNREDTIERLTLESVAFTHLQEFQAAEQKLAQAERLCAAATYAECGGVLRARGIFAMERGQLTQARQFFLDSLSFARADHDRALDTTALLNLGFVSLQSEHYDEAMDWSKAAYQAGIELGDENRVQGALGNLGWAYFQLGDADKALESFLDAGKRAAKLGNIREELKWMTTAGYVYQATGKYGRASQAYRQALDLATQINSKQDIINSLEVLAHLTIEIGHLDEASAYLEQVTPLVNANGNRLDALDVMLARGRIDAARRQDQQAEAIFRTIANDPASQTSMRLGAEHELARLDEMQGNLAVADRMYRTALMT